MSFPGRWKVAKLTSEISSSLKGISSDVPGGSIPAAAPHAVAAKDAPATLKTVKAFVDLFLLGACFVCVMKWLLLPLFPATINIALCALKTASKLSQVLIKTSQNCAFAQWSGRSLQPGFAVVNALR
jgi:hypothetical protein